MTDRAFEVLGLGNALVDVLGQEDFAFVEKMGLNRGSMNMVDVTRSEEIYRAMGPATEVSGGSAANTIAGVASFGGRGVFLGRVREDQLGRVFRHDIRSLGVVFESEAAVAGPPTGRCLVIVTPDAERTLCTTLGASADFGPEDVDAELVAGSAVAYLEGYLYDQPVAKEAMRLAARQAAEAGNLVAFTLSDPFCVDRHRDDFLEFVRADVDLLFANEAEILALYEVEDFDDALQQVREDCTVAALTRSELGCVVVAGDEVHVIDAVPVDTLVDTTGAGDQFAAGFLFGYTQGYDLATCGRLGALGAAEVISHLGARPQTSLAELAAPLLNSAPRPSR